MFQARSLHYTYTLSILSFLIFSITVLSCSGPDSRNGSENTPEDRQLTYETQVAFLSSAGDTLSVIDAAVADDQESRTQGLMNVT